MIIALNLRPISIGKKYDILVNGKQLWLASKEILNVLSNLYVTVYPDGPEVIEIRQQNLWISPDFSIRIAGKARLQFTTISNSKFTYQCIDGKDTYNIYGHSGTTYSVFKNDVQIAFWDTSSFNALNGTHIKICADFDASKELLVAFCLITENFSSSNDTDRIHIGKIGWNLREFDKTWRPKGP